MSLEAIEQENTHESSRHPSEQAARTIEQLDFAAESFVDDVLAELESTESESGATPEIVAAARDDIDLEDSLAAITRSVVASTEDTKNKIETVADAHQATTSYAPIKVGEHFLPEVEVRHILKAPSKERRALLEQFKEKYVYQKEGIALLQEHLVNTVQDNPDLTLREFHGKIKAYSNIYGFDSEYRLKAFILATEYAKRHRAVKTARELFPDDAELFRQLLGFAPEGEIEIHDGPMTFYIRCTNPHDYARIYYNSFVTGKEIGKEEIQHAGRSTGCLRYDCRIEALSGTIMAKNLKGSLQDNPIEHDGTTRKHEEQHAIYNLFRTRLAEEGALIQFELAEDWENQEKPLREYLKIRRATRADDWAKDEFLAYLRAGDETQGVVQRLKVPKSKGGTYDYLVSDRERVVDAFVERYGEDIRKMIEDAVQDIYTHDYHATLEAAANALDDLRAAYYSPDEIVGLLTTEPLDKWPKVVSRLLHE